MATKITRQLAEESVKKLLDKSQVIMDSGCLEIKNYIASISYIDKGISVLEHHCHECGHTFIVPGSVPYYSWARSAVECPCCRNKYHTYSAHFTEEDCQLVVFEQEDGFDFVLANIEYKFPELNNTWHKESPEVSLRMRYVGMYRDDYGWAVYGVYDEKLYKRDCQAEVSALDKVRTLTPRNNIIGDWDEMLAKADAFDADRKAKNATKRAKSKPKLLGDMRIAFTPKPVNEDAMMAELDTILYDVYSTKDGATTYMTYCTKCGDMQEVTSVEDVICPVCGTGEHDGRRHYSSNRYTSGKFAVFENTNLPENDLLLRLFEARMDYDPMTHELKRSVWERQRIFFGNKITVFNNGGRYQSKAPAVTKFVKESVRDIDYSLAGYHLDAKIIQEPDEIRDIIRASCLVYSGLVESYGFGDSRYMPVESAPSLKYILAWYKNPCIELVLKANLIGVVRGAISRPEVIGEGKTLAEVLRVTPHVAKMAVKLNCDSNQLTNLSALYNADNKITADLYREIQEMNVSIGNLVRLKTQFNIDFTQAIKYLDAVYNHQCIHKGEALSLWLDYLNMATALRINLEDKSRLYPGSLKKEHDVATFAYKAVQVEIDKEQFAKQAKLNEFYEYSYKDLVVVVPKTPQDIVEEATRQKNCLRSYVERVKRGDTVVVFIRRKIMPDATYVTAEVYQNKLMQLKGYCNSNPRDKELVEFVQHWSKAKGIIVDC